MNIVEALDVGDGTRRFELNLDHHHDHLICTSCHKIIEFTDDIIELKQIKIAEKNGFVLKNHVMSIYGLCEECQKTDNDYESKISLHKVINRKNYIKGYF